MPSPVNTSPQIHEKWRVLFCFLHFSRSAGYRSLSDPGIFFFFWKWASARLLRLPGPQNLMQVCAHVLSCWDGHDRKDSMFFLWSPRVYKHNTSVPGAKSHPRWLSHTASPTLPTQELNSVIAFLKEDRGTKIHGKLNSGMAAESK